MIAPARSSPSSASPSRASGQEGGAPRARADGGRGRGGEHRGPALGRVGADIIFSTTNAPKQIAGGDARRLGRFRGDARRLDVSAETPGAWTFPRRRPAASTFPRRRPAPSTFPPRRPARPRCFRGDARRLRRFRRDARRLRRFRGDARRLRRFRGDAPRGLDVFAETPRAAPTFPRRRPARPRRFRGGLAPSTFPRGRTRRRAGDSEPPADWRGRERAVRRSENGECPEVIKTLEATGARYACTRRLFFCRSRAPCPWAHETSRPGENGSALPSGWTDEVIEPRPSISCFGRTGWESLNHRDGRPLSVRPAPKVSRTHRGRLGSRGCARAP
jgi:hypothetical protein